jgi:hypothetical protein
MAGRPVIELRPAPRGAAVPETAEQLLRVLGGPSMLVLEGRDASRTRGIATLLHGNEPSGVRALTALLRSDLVPATRVVCLVASVDAALAPPGFAQRMLPGRRDLNRCFRPPWDDADGALAGEALRLLRESGCEALIDLHNNTGRNPAYGVATGVDAARLGLVALFASRYVTTDLRLGSLIEATEGDFPTVAIECGRAGDPAADAIALAGLQRYLSAPALETRRMPSTRMTVLSEPVRVCVRPGMRLAFGDVAAPDTDLTLMSDIDRHNFSPVLPGAPVGWLGARGAWPIEARGADGEDVSSDLFHVRDGRLETRRGLVPIMMTTDVAVALADCLFYVVQEREEVGGSGREAG